MNGRGEDFLVFGLGVMMLAASLMVFMIVAAFALALFGHPHMLNLLNSDGPR